jgi:hypothetical protein
MTDQKSKKAYSDELRRRAEEQNREHSSLYSPPLSKQDCQRLVHELQVHQIELEMQNEELRMISMNSLRSATLLPT